MLKRSPKELRDHLVLESPQLANVEFKFPVMRELIQHWSQSRRVFFPQKPPMEVAAVSTAARDSDVTVSAVGWHGSWNEKGHGEGKSRKERGKEKAKARERKARRKEERKARERATAGKEREIGGTSIMIRGGQNRSVVTVITVGNGVTRRPSALNGRGVVRWNLVQWCHILHRLLFLTLDPLCRNVFKLKILPLSHLSVGRNLLTMRRTGLMNGGTIRRVTGWKIGKMTGTGTIRKIVRVNGTTMKVPI